MTEIIKLSSPETRGFWKIPVLFEDDHLMALAQPADLPTVPDACLPDHPGLTTLLRRELERGAPWAAERGLNFLMPVNRLDYQASGVVLLAKNKPAQVSLANFFGSERSLKTYLVLVSGFGGNEEILIEAKLTQHPLNPGLMKVSARRGKRSVTRFVVREQFAGYCLLEAHPLTDRRHQVRIHCKCARLPLIGDRDYRGRHLLLSKLKSDYHLKPGQTERPLIARPAVHLERLGFDHPVTGKSLQIDAPLPKDFEVALKYLRRYAGGPAVTDGF